MKKTSTVLQGLAVAGAIAVVAGCASPDPRGILYTNVQLPVAGGPASTSTKTGTAECSSILGLVATGNCSIEAAKTNGGITTIDYVDFHADNILGVFGKYTTTVYGN